MNVDGTTDRATMESVWRLIGRLHRGRERAAPKGRLVRELHSETPPLMIGTRELELAVQGLRRGDLDGEPRMILSGSAGYWLSEDPKEIDRCLAQLEGRIRTQEQTVRAMGAQARRLREARLLAEAARAREAAAAERQPAQMELFR